MATQKTKKAKTPKSEAKPRIKKYNPDDSAAKASTKASPEEQALGVPENGFVILFRVFTKAEHEELVKLKKQIGEKLGEGQRATWPAVVKYAMRNAA